MSQPLMIDGKKFQIYNRIPPPIPGLSHSPRVFHPQPFPIILYKDFTQNTIKKLNQTSITEEEAVMIRFISNTAPSEGLEEEILRLLVLTPRISDPPSTQEQLYQM